MSGAGTVSGATRETEIAREQCHVDRAYARLHELREEAERSHREGFRLARVGNFGALVERDAMVYHTARRLRSLDAEYEGLVFGRLDLTDGEIRHVGRLGLRDADYEPLVIDWRAPGAAAFYQATAEDPMGVVRRRVIRCSGQRVLDVEDDLLDLDGADAVPVVGEGALLATLARARGTHMRDIVATIQREQDEAIRAPAGGVTLIEGGPGTGKTAVALHRAAHLLYRDRRRFEGGGVLLVGPSPVFMSYVERVLPSLGEDTVELRSLGQVLDGVRADRLDPPALAAVKGSLQIRRLLGRAVREAPPGAPRELKIVYAAEVLRIREATLAGLRKEVHRRVQRANAGQAEARRVLVDALWRQRPADVSWNQRRFVEDVADRRELDAFIGAWWPVRTPAEVLAGLGDPARLRRLAGNAYPTEQLAASWAEPEPSVADVALLDELRVLLGEPPRPKPKRDADFEDLEGLQELSTYADRHLSRPERPPRPDNYDGYAHVLVDEAQDVSPMQWRMLGRRGQQASWTIVGDAAQSAWPDPAEAQLARGEALRGKQVRRFHLSTNYRNSAEIFEFAAAVVRKAVPDADLPDAVRRTGQAPEHRFAKAGPATSPGSGPSQGVDRLGPLVEAAVAELLQAVEGTIGVVTPSARRAEVAAYLTDRPERVQVVDGMQAKGMEYDGVVVVDPAGLAGESPAGIRVLYVALTRATHRLITAAPDPSWLPPI